MLNGSSSLFIEVESSSAVPDWMDLVSAKFKTKMSMEAMIFKQHQNGRKDMPGRFEKLIEGKEEAFWFFCASASL